jgi:hypothetical protein
MVALSESRVPLITSEQSQGRPPYFIVTEMRDKQK